MQEMSMAMWLPFHSSSRDKRDLDVVREHHQFLWDEEEDDPNASWSAAFCQHSAQRLSFFQSIQGKKIGQEVL
jgi:hypothetical protein